MDSAKARTSWPSGETVWGAAANGAPGAREGDAQDAASRGGVLGPRQHSPAGGVEPQLELAARLRGELRRRFPCRPRSGREGEREEREHDSERAQREHTLTLGRDPRPAIGRSAQCSCGFSADPLSRAAPAAR